MTETKKTGGGLKGFFRRIGAFIKKHKKLTVFLAIVVIVAVVAVVLMGGMNSAAASAAAAPQTITLQSMELEQIVSATGSVQSAQARDVTTAGTGEITEVHVAVGDVVKQGQALAQLDTADIEKSIADVKKDISKAQASDKISLDAAQRRLDEAVEQYSIDEASYGRKIDEAAKAIEDARDAAGVAAGDAALNGGAQAAGAAASAAQQQALVSAQSDLAIAEAELAQREKELAAARSVMDATDDPSAEYDAAKLKYDEAKSIRDAAKAAADAAQSAVGVAQSAYNNAYNTAVSNYKKNNRSVYDSAYRKAYDNANVSALQSQYDTTVESRDTILRNDNNSIASARESLASQKLMDSAASYKTQLENYEDQLLDATITAPVGGTIIEMGAEVGLTPTASSAAGATGGASTALFTIEDTGALEISVSVSEYDAVDISEGMQVDITSDALGGEEWSGTVASVSPAATDTGGNFTVVVKVTTATEKLAIGMSAKINIVTASKADVFAVPYDAVTTDDAGRTVVYAEAEEGGAASAPDTDSPAPAGTAIEVETGMETDYYIEIIGEGLAEGMTILADPEGKNVSTGSTSGGFMMRGGF